MTDDASREKTVADQPSRTSIVVAAREGSANNIATPQQAMDLLEARRAWTYATGIAALCAFAAVIVLLLGGDPIARRLHVAGLAATCLGATLCAIRWRDPADYRSGQLLILLMISLAANVTGYVYWGMLSGFLGVVAVSGYAFASVSPQRTTIFAVSAVSGLHLVVGIAQLSGWIDDRGLLVPAAWATTSAKIAFLAVIQIVMATAVAGGADTKRQMKRILDEHYAAQRALSQKDAQLAEARYDAQQARAPGVGRYTGQRLGRFALREVIGRGAMGEVYAAVDDADAAYAIKLLAPSLLDNADALRRFQREARVIQSITSPSIVRMIEISPPDATMPFLAMERLVGEDLGQMLKQRPVRSLDEALSIAQGVAAGLDAAHAAGVVHRDLKPANIFAAETGAGTHWKILDFGVSKLLDGEATLTTNQLVGTPGYMSPEQARGESLDRRADVYSLGVVLYRMLTGRPAVMPGEPTAMIHEVVYRMPPQPSSIVDLPLAVEDVLAIALAKSPADRFATAGELAVALAEAVAGPASSAVGARAKAILAATPWGEWLRRGHYKRLSGATVRVGA